MGSKFFRKRQKRSYTEQQRKQAEAWGAITESLEDKFLPTNIFDENTVCSICAEPAMFRCTDCGPWMSFCKYCCITQHNQCCFLHVPEKWEHGHFVPVMLMNVEIPLDHRCLTEYKDKVTIISLKGLFSGHIILLQAIGNGHLPLSHSYRLPLWSCGQFL